MVCGPAFRPRNAAATRDSILEAARERFSRHSYDDVGVRQIASDAGVDAALISRYFGSKDDLFAAVLTSCETGESLFDGPRETFGRRVADKVVYHPQGRPRPAGHAHHAALHRLTARGRARAQVGQ